MPRKASGSRRAIFAVSAIVIILALTLGLGLGLGLKHRHHANASQAVPPTSTLPLLTPQTSNNFVVGSIIGKSSQDRTYNFTIALANGAPDGVNKTVVVVNGMYLRPCRDGCSILRRPPAMKSWKGGS